MKKLISMLLATVTTFSLAACADMGEPAGSDDAPAPKEQTYTVTARYDYGMHRPNLATMLYDSSTLFFTLPEGFDPPVAGDEFTVTYTGQLLIQESYPSTVVIQGGKITSVSAEPAVIRTVRYNAKDKSLTLLDENGEEISLATGSIQFPEYYLIGTAGEFAEVSTLTEDTILYGSVSYTDRMSDGGVVFSGLYLANPREVNPEMQAKIRAVTDPLVRETYGVTDWSTYRIQIDYAENLDQYSVDYDLEICGYHTYESISIYLTPALTVVRHNSPNAGKYSCYLKNATEEAVSAAEDRLRAKIGDQEGGSGFYLQIDQEGYLCLAVEFIVSIDPPEPDENGYAVGGCGYDHKHVFYTERICGAD
ncbi:MAG: hypothetical protein IJX47_04305 [Clostridia bacterium]|nr:hypothetical protein [Clostridia bacterium]